MLHDDYHTLGMRIADSLPALTISAMFLPPLPDTDERGDCFGFLFLSDDSAGPFYASLDDTLARLRDRYPDGSAPAASPQELLDGFRSSDGLSRALALGAFNVLSQSLLRRAGYRPQPASDQTQPAPGERIGMVGFFGRLVRPWSERGVQIKILELAPERIPPLPGVTLARAPAELSDCDRVICTSSVLMNQTLDTIINAVGSTPVDLVGPSGSGLPDIPFARGVRSVGGMYFDDGDALRDALANHGHWGNTGAKFTLFKDSYPGVEALINRLRSRE